MDLFPRPDDLVDVVDHQPPFDHPWHPEVSPQRFQFVRTALRTAFLSTKPNRLTCRSSYGCLTKSASVDSLFGPSIQDQTKPTKSKFSFKYWKRTYFTIDQLPIDCLLIIFADLPLCDQFRLRQVCPRFRLAIDVDMFSRRRTLNLFLGGLAPVKQWRVYSWLRNMSSEGSTTYTDKDNPCPRYAKHRVGPDDLVATKPGKFTGATVRTLHRLFPKVHSLLVCLGERSPPLEPLITELISGWTTELRQLYVVAFDLPRHWEHPIRLTRRVLVDGQLPAQRHFSSRALYRAIAPATPHLTTLGLVFEATWLETCRSQAETERLLLLWSLELEQTYINDSSSAQADHHPWLQRHRLMDRLLMANDHRTEAELRHGQLAPVAECGPLRVTYCEPYDRGVQAECDGGRVAGRPLWRVSEHSRRLLPDRLPDRWYVHTVHKHVVVVPAVVSEWLRQRTTRPYEHCFADTDHRQPVLLTHYLERNVYYIHGSTNVGEDADYEER